MSYAWAVLLAASIAVSIVLVAFYEYYVYRQMLGWAQIVASLMFLAIIGLWLGFAVLYYKELNKSIKLLCEKSCAPGPKCVRPVPAKTSISELVVITD